MAKLRSFVPEGVTSASLEGRVVLSTFSDIGNWFSSQYHHVTQDLGITHKHNTNAAAGIQELWNSSAKAPKPAHGAHAATTPRVTANDTVKLLS
jgi:hypothetical protein